MNEEAQLAWNIIETTGTSLFLTGRAGTGKTTFLRNLKEHTSKCAVVVAPTGIAALNAGGVTMHSFFQLPFAPYVPGAKFGTQGSQVRMSKEKKRVICAIDLLVIDEISMVRADVLDSVDYVLRLCRRDKRPFGGVQLLMIGDLGQLAPVVKDEEWMKNCRVWMYRGAWAEWEMDHVEMAVPISPEELRFKRNAILKHQSQAESAPFLGDDERLFWQRAEDRNRATAELYHQLGLASYEAMEAFVQYIPLR